MPSNCDFHLEFLLKSAVIFSSSNRNEISKSLLIKFISTRNKYRNKKYNKLFNRGICKKCYKIYGIDEMEMKEGGIEMRCKKCNKTKRYY
ncbi:hypothetical protein NUSPORA_02506 [Nucleospora cyclopteri]